MRKAAGRKWKTDGTAWMRGRRSVVSSVCLTSPKVLHAANCCGISCVLLRRRRRMINRRWVRITRIKCEEIDFPVPNPRSSVKSAVKNPSKFSRRKSVSDVQREIITGDKRGHLAGFRLSWAAAWEIPAPNICLGISGTFLRDGTMAGTREIFDGTSAGLKPVLRKGNVAQTRCKMLHRRRGPGKPHWRPRQEGATRECRAFRCALSRRLGVVKNRGRT